MPAAPQSVASRERAAAARIAELEQALARAREAVEALRRVGAAVGTAELDELLDLIVTTTTGVLDADRATLYLREGDRLVSRVRTRDEEGSEAISLAIGQGIAGYVAEVGEPIRLRDATRDPRFDPTWDERSGYRTKSMVAVPLLAQDDTPIGVLQVLNKRRRKGRKALFTPYDTELLEAMAMQAVVALGVAGLLTRLRRKNVQLAATTEKLARSLGDLELLYELETSLSKADTLEELARATVSLVGESCGATAGSLLARNRDGELTLHLVRLPEGGMDVVAIQPGEGIAGRALEHDGMLRIDDGRKIGDPRRVKELLGRPTRHAIATALGDADDEVGGSLVLYNQRGGFSDDDVALLRLVSANVLTELRVLESRRERAQAERLSSIGQLLSGVMHDLKTPLTVISGYLQLMEGTDDPALRREHGQTVREQFEIIDGMQRDLLAYARGETTLLVRKVFVDRFLDRLVRLYATELDETPIRVILDERVGPSVAYLDESRLKRALDNLIRNAIEALEGRKGTITVGGEVGEEDVRFWVADTGPGIPKAIRNTLFDPFVTRGKKTGTGLGLASVKEIVDEHGGEVSVDSSRRGTCFTVTLPGASRPKGMRPLGAGPRSRRSR